MTENANVGVVYKAISAVQNALAAKGISKAKKNAQQGYNFRGIDDVYDALSPILAEHGLCILPRILTRECSERQTRAGGAMFSVTVEAEFDLVSAEDGSRHTVRTFGEAMDSGDKATNKAMSAAYKYAAFQTFCIPVDVEDADATTPPEVKAKPKVAAKPEAAPEPPVSTNAEKPAKAEKPADGKSAANRKALEARIGEKGIDRETFKEWLDTIGWLQINDDGRRSMKDLSDSHVKYLLDKWDSATAKFNAWVDKMNAAPTE